MKALNWMYFLFVSLQVDGSIIGEEGGGGGISWGLVCTISSGAVTVDMEKKMANWLNW